MRVVEDLDSAAMTARYFAGRRDGLLLRGKAGTDLRGGVDGRQKCETDRRDDVRRSNGTVGGAGAGVARWARGGWLRNSCA